MTKVRSINGSARASAGQVIKMMRLAATRQINSHSLSEELNCARNTAQKYITRARAAGALVAVDDSGWTKVVAHQDSAVVAAFLVPYKKLVMVRANDRTTRRDQRMAELQMAGRHIHLCDANELTPLPNVAPVFRDPFDALFFGNAKVAA